MKTMRYVLLTGALLGLLAACNMPHEPEVNKQLADGKVLVSVQVVNEYSETARSVLPQISLDEVDRFALWGAPLETAETELLHSFTQAGSSIALNPGTWNFTVNGYNGDDELILKGELKSQPVSSVSNSFTFSLSPLLDGTGSILITITLPGDSGVTTAAVFKDGVIETSSLTLENNCITYSANPVAAGDYFYSFRLNNNAGNTIAVVSQMVQVRARLRSEKAIVLTAASLNTLPDAPIAAPHIVAGDSQLTVSWEEVAMVGDYQVYYSDTDVPPDTPAQSVSNTITTVISGLINGRNYYVWIKAENAVGTSDYSPRASGMPLPLPAAPEQPSVTIGDSQLTLSWNPVTRAASYEVYYSTGSTAPDVAGANIVINGTSAIISGLSNGTTYHVWVKAINAVGVSPYSEMASGKPLATPGSAPTINAGASGQLSVSWVAAVGADEYAVYCGTGETPPGEAAETTTTRSATLTGLTNGTTYHIWVKAKNVYGVSGFSPRASGKPLGEMGTVTVTPSSEELTVSWEAVVGADEYEVYYGTSLAPTTLYATVSDLAISITGLSNETLYYVRLKARNAIGASSYSEAASGTPSALAVPPAAPNTPAVSIGNAQLTVSWTAIENALQYEVYYGTTETPETPATTVSETSTTITGLSNGTLYYVRLRAKNAAGVSGWSETASGMPLGIGNASIRIGFNYGQITIEGSNGINAISKSGSNDRPTSLRLSASGYTNVSWYVDGDTANKIADSGTGITLSAANYPVQIHSITFTGTRNGVLYAQKIPFTVYN